MTTDERSYLGDFRQAVDSFASAREKLYSLWEKGEIRIRNDDIEQILEELHKIENNLPDIREVIAAFQSMNQITLVKKNEHIKVEENK